MPEMIFEQVLTPEGWQQNVLVCWEAGIITRVETDMEMISIGGIDRVAGAMVPGIGNLHSHAFQRGFAGLTERRGANAQDHFWTWREAMYRFSAAMTPERLQAIAALAQIEMLESGFTSVAEFHYIHHQTGGHPYDDPAEMAAAIVAAAQTTGIGLTLLPVFYAHGGFDDMPIGEAQKRFACTLDQFSHLVERAQHHLAELPMGRVGIAPHSLRAVNAMELARLTARHGHGPIHIHIAEQTGEVEDCLAATGMRPVERLFDTAEIDARWCLVHATHVTPGEISRMAASGAVAGLCPITEADLGDGIFPAVEYCAHNGWFGVGSDSNVLISLPQELRLLEQSQRLRDRARNRLVAPPRSTGRTLFDAAAAGGARALGLPTGRIAAGASADFVVLDKDHPALLRRKDDALLDAWIFAAATNPVRDVWAAGRQVVAAGQHVTRRMVEADWRRTLNDLGDL